MADILEKIKNNDLSDEEKENIIKLFTPKIPYHMKPENKAKNHEVIRNKYHSDEDFRRKVIDKQLEYYYKKNADKELKPRGRKKIYDTPEEKRAIYNEKVKEKYHEKTKDKPKMKRGRKPLTLEETIRRLHVGGCGA